MSSPRLLLLAGKSCSGKTSLGEMLQRSLIPQLWMFWEADRSAPKFPPIYRDLQKDDTERVTEALAVQARLVRAELNAIRSYLDVGFNMIVERFLWDKDHWAIASDVLGLYEPLVIELRCDLDTLEKREKDRGTTSIGFARKQAEEDEWLIPADLILDSSQHSTEDLVASVIDWLNGVPGAH